VVTTVSEALEFLDAAIKRGGNDVALAQRARALIIRNLRLLREAGVTVVIGSDRYAATSLPEALGLRATGVYDDTTLKEGFLLP
jgi:imidazolonepropionase-like amidohydrolase